MSRRAPFLVVTLGALVLSACSASVSVGGTPEVSRDKLAPLVADKLAATVGERPASVVCSDDLKAKSGQSRTVY